MRGIVVISFFLLVVLEVGNGVPQIYTHLFRVPPVGAAPIVIPNADAAPAVAPTLYHHVTGQDCPTGFFSIDDTSECFVLLNNITTDWTGARTSCRDLGLDLAQPSPQSVPAVVMSMVDIYGIRYPAWVGARRATPDSPVLWQKHDPTTSAATGIPFDSPLWNSHRGPDISLHHDDVGSWTSEFDPNCVFMMVRDGSFTYPSQPYGLGYCGENRYPLCQAFDPEKE